MNANTPTQPLPEGYDAAWVEKLLLAPDRVRRYPRASRYDLAWIYSNEVGSMNLWLVEALMEAVPHHRPGMRVLNLGCGKAIESIFLAKEYGFQVWAGDLWFDPNENYRRICEAGFEDRVFPMRLDALNMPFPDGYFDLVVSINSIQFYGTSDTFLGDKLARVVRPGGRLAVVVPGLYREFENGLPEHLQPFWEPGFYAWHSPEWWARNWRRSGQVEMELADTFEDGEGYTIFATWEEAKKVSQRMVLTDAGRNITFVRLVARRK